MRERPILFSGPMVRALLAGTKTQTRRICRDQTATGYEYVTDMEAIFAKKPTSYTGWAKLNPGLPFHLPTKCPYGSPGDRLWVREGFYLIHPTQAAYSADASAILGDYHFAWRKNKKPQITQHRPSIHMPRWASRLTLEIVSVRVERLWDISEADAVAEGIGRYDNGTFGLDDPAACMGLTAKIAYMRLWESINGPGSWEKNPWVWVVEFRPSSSSGQAGKEAGG
jgi:hypothetical protein